MWFPTIVNIFFTKLSGSWNTDKTFCDRVFNDDYVTNFTNMEYNINFTGICVDTLSEYTVFSGMFSGFLYCMLSLVVIKVAFYRRMVLIFWLTVAGVSCTLVDLYQPAVSLVFLVLLQTSTVGLPSLASYFVDLYPTSCRGMVGSLSMMVTRICSIGAVNLVGAAITTNCSLTFYGWAGFAFSHGRYNYMLLIGCCVITMGVGMDMFGFAIIVTVSKCDLKLGLTETGVLASAPLAGVLFAYPWGYYADTRGRRRALLLSTFVGFVFAAVCSFSPSWQLMMFFKLVSCSFSTASYTLTMTMLGECTGCAHRNQYLFILNSINLLSDCFSFGLAYFLLPLQLNYHMPYLDMTYRPWRLLTLVLALPLGIGGLMMLYLHESPKFLASRGDNKKSLDVLRSIYTWNGGDEQKFPVQMLLTTDAVEDENISLWESLKKQTIPIFKPPLLWRTIQLTYLLIVCICTNNGFAMWFPTIVNIFFTKLSGSWNTDKTFCDRVFNDDYVTNFTNMEYNINFTGICVDTLSEYTVFSGMFSGFLYCMLSLVVIKVAFYRRIVLIFWLTVAGVSCTLVDLYQPAVSLVFLVLLQTSTVGLPSLASYFVDLYPTSCRGMVGSLSMMVTRICSIGAVNLVGAAITTNCSLTFYGWAGFAFSGVAVAYFLPRDKKMEVTKL